MKEAIRLESRAIVNGITETLKGKVKSLSDVSGAVPTLATILVGNDPASATYVRMKKNACLKVGISFQSLHLPENTTTSSLLQEIERLNHDPDVNGILLQHPTPSQIDERACFDAIAIEKDVDGVTSEGFGKMTMGAFAYGSATLR